MSQSINWVWYVGLVSILYVLSKILKDIYVALKVFVWAQVKARYTDRRLPEVYGKWSVVTGATDGIGKAYARELAKAGHDIILISRTLEKLQKVAAEIKNEFGVQTEVIQADYSQGRPIYEGISKALEGKEIGILVNNVGAMTEGMKKFDDLSEDEVWKLVNINVASVPTMTQMILPSMLERRRGAIINIASIASLMPLPYMQIYSATKAFVNYFSRALTFEYRSSGLTIQAVLPGMVVTNMTSIEGKLQKKHFFMPDADTYAAHALATLGYTHYTTGYWTHALEVYAWPLIPEWLSVMLFEKEFEANIKRHKTK